MSAVTKKLSSRLSHAKEAAGPTIGAGYVKGLLEFAVSKGAPRDALLEKSQLVAHELEDLDNRIPVARYEALLKAGAEILDEPALALQFGEAVRMQDISIVGLICEACETTADVGTQLNRYGRLVYDEGGSQKSDALHLVRKDDALWMEVINPIFKHNSWMTESEFARLVWNTRIMFASHPDFPSIGFPLEIHFTHAEPNYRAEYDRIFGVPLVFGASWNAMRIDPRFLALRQPPISRYVFGVLSERAQMLLQSLESSKTARGRVESLLIPTLHTGDPSIERIAQKMALSRQTLYRQLKAEGVTFEKLLDELRHKMALHYLDGKKVSVNETAYLVGFSDPSAFSRAFRRWTGTSPRKRAM